MAGSKPFLETQWVDWYPWNLLDESALRSLPPFLNSLLDQVAGLDVNYCYEDENDKTLLHVACDHEDLEAAKLLVSKGRAKVNVVNPNLRITPIHVAARKGNVDLMR